MNNPKVNNLDIYITGKCNYTCGYCFGEDDRYGQMDQSVYASALAFAKYLGAKNIGLCGGEPLVCPDFENFISLAKKQQYDVILRTNGILLNKKLNFIANNCKWVGVSLDGLPEINAKMRRSKINLSPEEQFSMPVNAIFRLKEINPGIRILLATLASRINSKYIPELAEYLIKHNVPIDRWKIYEFIEDKFRSGHNASIYSLSEPDFIILRQNLPVSINGAQILLQSARGNRVAANCLIVYQNGDIILLGKKYGNVREDNFSIIVDKLDSEGALTPICDNKANTYGS